MAAIKTSILLGIRTNGDRVIRYRGIYRSLLAKTGKLVYE